MRPTVLTLREAAIAIVARADGDPVSARIWRAVDAQCARCRIERADREDVRHDVIVALLAHPATDRREPVEIVCARIAVIARNKAVDHVRVRARGPLPLVQDRLERAGASLDDELEPTEAIAHRDRMVADLRRALAGLGESERIVLAVQGLDGGPVDAQMARTTYYRMLGRAHARLRIDLRDRIAGAGLVGWLARRLAPLAAPKLGALLGAAAVAVAVGALTAPGPARPEARGAVAAPVAATASVAVAAAGPPVIRARSAQSRAPAARGGVSALVVQTRASSPARTTSAQAASRCAVYDPNPYVC